MIDKSLDERALENTSPGNDKHPTPQLRPRFNSVQLIIMGLWLGLPIAILLLTWLVNPVYEGELFRSGSNSLGAAFLILGAVAETTNALVLYFGFRLTNHFLPVDKSRQIRRSVVMTLVVILTFLLFTVPIMLIVLLAPAAVVISRQPIR